MPNLEKPLTQTAKLTLHSQIKRLDEIEDYDLNETAMLTFTDDATYLRYSEWTEATSDAPAFESKLMLKIQADGSIKMRRTGPLSSQLHFDPNRETTTNYQTPAGNIVLKVLTNELQIKQNPDKTTGALNISYQLTESGLPLGDYMINIHYQV